MYVFYSYVGEWRRRRRTLQKTNALFFCLLRSRFPSSTSSSSLFAHVFAPLLRAPGTMTWDPQMACYSCKYAWIFLFFHNSCFFCVLQGQWHETQRMACYSCKLGSGPCLLFYSWFFVASSSCSSLRLRFPMLLQIGNPIRRERTNRFSVFLFFCFSRFSRFFSDYHFLPLIVAISESFFFAFWRGRKHWS